METQLPVTPARDMTVDLVVIGSGTGMAAALAAHERGLSTLIVEKTEFVGGSTARSGGAFWIPGNRIMRDSGSHDTTDRAAEYLKSLIGDPALEERWTTYLANGSATVDMLLRTTPLEFFWTKGYSDYHPELPGGSAVGRTCESKPFNASILGAERARVRPSSIEGPVPLPIAGADFKWLNMMARVPWRGIPALIKVLAKGFGGKARGREYITAGQALVAGMYAGVLDAGIPVWTRTSLDRILTEDGRVVGVSLTQDGRRVTVTANEGVVLAAGGFDHDVEMRREHQLESYEAGWSLGNEANTGEGIKAAVDVGAELGSMDQAWWFPEVAPVPGGDPLVMLAERSLPGSFIVDGSGRRFINESTDYMTFGQAVQARERAGNPVGDMWIVFDKRYRNSYMFAGAVFPRMDLPAAWYESGVAHRASTVEELARSIGVDPGTLAATFHRFNELAETGSDDDFNRGASAYDRYYGDPTVVPNPCLRPLGGDLYAVKVVLGDLGTCGGVCVDEFGRVVRSDGEVIEGLYALGNNAANAFGKFYPGAGATIGQGLVFAYVVAEHAARQRAALRIPASN
ncbi:3-ketosteroid-delta-1-dehydrogenase [Gordonia sp. NPDC127522]|uniref:3-ketosteroid-delta-1-dehydrogenase n=1 Tax=Gordonia sp. NPDC127522 TaxID=3345390 RepID=UPI00363A9AEC